MAGEVQDARHGAALSPDGLVDASMVWLAGATFHMGSDDHYPEEAPVHPVRVDGFWIDRFPVTNRDFARFVEDTGHVTVAEQVPSPADYPLLDPHLLVAGSLVFSPPEAQPGPAAWDQWWRFVEGADWRHPKGPGSSLEGLEDHPVVHVAFADAQAYARWCHKALPTEAEWEYAARGGLDRAPFAWGNELVPGGIHRANTWQGAFPVENLAEDGFAGTSPVDAFPANGFGLHDMIGNVWEWTDDWYQPRHDPPAARPCCVPHNPRGGSEAGSRHADILGAALPRKVLKGGSHLCAPNYCQRYRPAARSPQTIDTASGHIGFRCVRRGPKQETK